MTICIRCGNTIERGMQFCSECGTSVQTMVPPRTVNPPIGSPTRPIYPDYGQTFPPPQMAGNPQPPPPNLSNSLPPTQIMSNPLALGYPPVSTPAPKRGANALIVLISFIALIAIAAAIYFALSSSPASKLASALRNAVSNNQLVTLSGNDAFTYYMQLRSLDPAHSALKEVGPQVLSPLKDAGEEVFRKKTVVNAERDTLQDWLKAQNIYEWAHDIVPGDQQVEARWRFAQGEVAKQQSRKDEAERSFQSAAQVNNSWALPPNSLGLLRSENKRWGEAIPYFQKAVDLQPNWEVPYNNLGTAYLYLKDYNAARTWYEKALEKNPNWARPHYWLGSVYEQLNDKAQAIAEYERALTLGRDNLPLDSYKVQEKIDKLRSKP
jgi:tetratricopeptide (TPR) repeat protein